MHERKRKNRFYNVLLHWTTPGYEYERKRESFALRNNFNNNNNYNNNNNNNTISCTTMQKLLKCIAMIFIHSFSLFILSLSHIPHKILTQRYKSCDKSFTLIVNSMWSAHLCGVQCNTGLMGSRCTYYLCILCHCKDGKCCSYTTNNNNNKKILLLLCGNLWK